MRLGTVMAVWDGTNVAYTDYSTADYGDTSPTSLSVDINGSNVELLLAITSGTWTIKIGIIII
jgi:hypothetical protein